MHGGIEMCSGVLTGLEGDRKSTRLNSSHGYISYAVFCLKKKTTRTLYRPRLSRTLPPISRARPPLKHSSVSDTYTLKPLRNAENQSHSSRRASSHYPVV